MLCEEWKASSSQKPKLPMVWPLNYDHQPLYYFIGNKKCLHFSHGQVLKVLRGMMSKCAGKGRGGLKPPQILSSCSIMCTSQKDVQNSEDKWGKKQLSGYKQCYTYNTCSLIPRLDRKASEPRSLAILEAKPLPLLKSCLLPELLHLSETFKVEE